MAFIDPDAAPAAPAQAFVDPDEQQPTQAAAPPPVDDTEFMKALGRAPSYVAGTAPQKQYSIGERLNAMGEAAANTAAGMAGFIGGIPELAANEGTDKQGQSKVSDFFTKKLYDNSSPIGQEYTDRVGQFINDVGLPMAGIHLGVPEPMRERTGKSAIEDTVNKKLDSLTPKAAPKPFVDPDAGTPAGTQLELPLTNDISQSPVAQAAREASPQADMFEGPNAQVQGMVDEQAGRRYQSAQDIIDQRQAQLEQDTARSTLLDMNAAERARQEQAPVAGLEDAQGRALDESAARTRQYMDERNQGLIDDTDQGYMANQYGGGQDGLRVDENGMPINAARSMEAANLENPLQRNLWGDELPRQSAQEATRGITSAIDRMPVGGDRAAALEMLGVPKFSGKIKGKQRGAIDMSVFDPAYKRIKQLDDGVVLRMEGRRSGPLITATDSSGKRIGEVGFTHDTWARPPKPTDNLEAGWVTTDPKKMSNMPDADRMAPTTPATRKGLAAEMYKFAAEQGNDIVRSGAQTEEGKAMWDRFAQRGLAQEGKIPGGMLNLEPKGIRVPAGQRGAIDMGPLRPKSQPDVGKPDPLSTKEKLLPPEVRASYIPKPMAPADIISTALAEGKDGPSLWKNTQSGLANAAEKAKSALMQQTARWLSYAEKTGDRASTTIIDPIKRTMNKLSKEDLIASQAILRRESEAGIRFDPDQLKQAGLSDKAIAAHQQLRAAFDDVLNKTNETLRALGKKEITPENAYMASKWSGNWHVPLLDHSGKLAWYLKVETKGEAVKALQWMKDNGMDKTLDLTKAEPKYMPENIGSRVPRDVMGAYQDMLQFFDGDTAKEMSAAMQAYTEQQGFKFQKFNEHLKNKQGIRGFQGDRPWLSEHDNALSQAKAQVSYLQDAYRWAPMQEALANVKQVLADPELNKQQPNNMEMTKAYTAQAMGVSNNMLKAVENAVNKFNTSHSLGKLGTWVGSLKEMTYLTQLGLSGGYMIATPLQSFLLGPSWHQMLSQEGFKHNVIATAAKAASDFSLGLIGHEIDNVTGKKTSIPMTAIGREAFKYMEDNGLVSANLFNDQTTLGENKVLGGLRKTVGLTISIPERIARAATFMSFVHHLDGNGLSHTEIFQRSEELTNHVLTDFRKMSRPLAVDKFGLAGELAYVYKSPLFNQYNNLGIFARQAAKGNPMPFITALGMTAVLGGLTQMPFVNEADSLWEMLKNAVASEAPSLYPKVAGLGVKGTIISHMNEVSANDSVQAAIGPKAAKALGDTGAYGGVSAATGAQMASRFSSAIGDVSTGILGNMAPVGQEMKEWAKGAGVLTDPNRMSAEQGIYSAIAPPAVRGNMETSLDDFKGPNRGAAGQSYLNGNNIANKETTYVRTPHEEDLRRLGMTSLQEATTKSNQYITSQENHRYTVAQDASIDKMFAAIINKDPDRVSKYAESYIANLGDPDKLNSEIDKKMEAYGLTPQERALVKAQSLQAVDGIQRMRKLQGHY